MLTQTAVLAAKPKEKAYKLADGDGLYLLIETNCSKLWRFRYQFERKEKCSRSGGPPLRADGRRTRNSTSPPLPERYAEAGGFLPRTLQDRRWPRMVQRRAVEGTLPSHARGCYEPSADAEYVPRSASLHIAYRKRSLGSV
jgi:hypothetical protein